MIVDPYSLLLISLAGCICRPHPWAQNVSGCGSPGSAAPSPVAITLSARFAGSLVRLFQGAPWMLRVALRGPERRLTVFRYSDEKAQRLIY